MQQTISNPNDLPSVLKALSDMIWWYENTKSKAEAFAVLARQPERPDQKHTPLEYKSMANQARVQLAKDLVLIQRLCRQANNLITNEVSRDWTDETKRLAHITTTASIKEIPFVRE